MTPSYVALLESGEFEDRVRHLESMLADCTVCPHECRVDRRSAVGICATGSNPVVASCTSHFGEEPVISGHHGSGTVFFANCNLRCVFCQNHEISQRPHHYHDTAITTDELADVFLDLQRQGCHNINWVSPSHQVPQLVRSLHRAACRGLRLPVVYNSNGFDAVEVLRLLEGVVDIYMPDLKYADSDSGLTCSRVADYPQHARSALEEMFRQVGDTWTKAPDGTLVRGLLWNPQVLLADEPLAGLDEDAAVRCFDLLLQQVVKGDLTIPGVNCTPLVAAGKVIDIVPLFHREIEQTMLNLIVQFSNTISGPVCIASFCLLVGGPDTEICVDPGGNFTSPGKTHLVDITVVPEDFIVF